MTMKKVLFKNLPFVPVNGQVIYVERSFDERINKFILKNYDWLRLEFRRHRLEFCYIPLFAKEVLLYNAPYLNDDERDVIIARVPNLLEYVDLGEIEGPSLLYMRGDSPRQTDKDEMYLMPIHYSMFTRLKSVFIGLATMIKKMSSLHSCRNYIYNSEKIECLQEDSVVRYSLRGDNILFRDDDDYAENRFDSESQRLVCEIRERIDALRNRGINTMFLHNIIDEGEHLSRLCVTEDFRIFLVDFNNLEIKMPALPKAVFLLFLRHLEGIRFKELSDYYSELLQIYLAMNPIGDRERHERSIREITDPSKNSINEKCARIREAFISNIDDRLAKTYYVTGTRGEAKRIQLNESMIIWE